MPMNIDKQRVHALLAQAKEETQEEFAKPNKMKGRPVPVFCCLNCATLYADEQGGEVLFDDQREASKNCDCKQITLVDARSIKAAASSGSSLGSIMR